MARHARSSNRRRIAVWAPVAVVVLLLGAWGVDTATGGVVVRNVEVEGIPVGRADAAELAALIDDHAAAFAARQVQVVTPDGTLTTTAAEVGLSVDTEATAQRARDAGRSFPLLRPFTWLVSLFSPYEVAPVIAVDEAVADTELVELQGTSRADPVEPTVALEDDGTVVLVPGQDGRGLDTAVVAQQLATIAGGGADPIVLQAAARAIPPSIDDAVVQAQADDANARTDTPLSVTLAGETREVEPAVVRSWLRLDTGEAGSGAAPALVVDQEAALASLRDLFSDVGEPGRNATMTLEGGVPVVVPSEDGTGCCAPDAGALVQAAVDAGSGAVALEIGIVPAAITTEEVQGYGIVEPIGGTRAWPDSRAGGVGPGFTTFHAAGESRVTNIHRIADLVRGVVVPPGETFSVNGHVGRRTVENGFVSAGAIRNGEHVSEVGGGVSQFATTLFNAAYFAGLDIETYQAHSEYFSRYPRGREATMGFPAPDLVFRNTTPYGILIWTSYTSSSLTVTLYSTPYATAEQTGIAEGRSGNCAVVTTTRTRTYPDKPDETDTFSATYRPGEGRFC